MISTGIGDERLGTGPGVRGHAQSHLLRIRSGIGRPWRLGLGVAGIVVVIGAWWVLAVAMAKPQVLPTPPATLSALRDLASDGTLWEDAWASGVRIVVGYAISIALGVVFGLLIGTFVSFESFFEAPVGFLRYIPASALTPVFLLWLGLGEAPKIWLIVIGTAFFNVLMMADVARSVPRELIDASYTLGARRWTVMRRVVLRWSVPGLIDAARVNLAAAWLMLVVAELLAADSGLAYQINRALRFRAVDKMFALLVVFGIIGLCSDLFLRWLRHRSAPWARA